MDGIFENLEQKIAGGYSVDAAEALHIATRMPLDEICRTAGGLRKKFSGVYFDTCSILNARSGKCPENCKWCSQSAFHNCEIDIYPLVGEDEAVGAAAYNSSKGVRRFSLVTSGRAVRGKELEKCCSIYRAIGKKVDIELCASMGLLNKSELQALYDSGVRRYHCNLETAPSYFHNLCTTHTGEDKIRTICWAQEVGMEVCSGGIIGMGESMEHRVELALTLKELGIRSIPVNILNPINGTALQGQPALGDEELVRSVAIFRIINPSAHIRLAGGRIRIKHLERKLLHCGVSSAIVGDMLTTTGSDIDTDKKMIAEEGFDTDRLLEL